MEYRRLGPTGMQVSAISLGAWLTYGSSDVENRTAINCLHYAIDHGINYIDGADMYSKGGGEEVVGRVAKSYDRDKLVISTKAYWPMSDDVNDRGLSRKHIVQSVENSLRRLDMDYIDIFFCHRYDMNTPTDESVRAIEDLIRQGKILYWGTSMWTADQLREGVAAAEKYNAYRPVVEQPRYNMLDREVVEGELERVLDEESIGLVVWSPLAGGVLTGKYNDGIPEGSRGEKWQDREEFDQHRIEKARELTAVAQEYGYQLPALALAWAMAHPNVDSVITGATRISQIEGNLKALDVELTAELEAKIEAILMNRPVGSERAVVTPDEVPAL